MSSIKKPEWAPLDGGREFASQVVPGKEGAPSKAANIRYVPFNKMELSELREKILERDRSVLARAMTLIESQSPKHRKKAEDLINWILPHTGKSVRIGMSGVPGAGKSTLIDTFGFELAERGHRVAVLAVDPSSSISKGSILGDKTRMEKLSVHPNSFIRPSPSGGTLGGVARKTREMILLAEAAGFDVIFIETVGVGQNEITVRSMVDFFILILISGAGDELQGIKKGVIEISDLILINKADGDNKEKAERARAQYEQALHYLSPRSDIWRTPVETCSAYTGKGISEIWDVVESYREKALESGFWDKNRKNQVFDWMDELIRRKLEDLFYQNPEVNEKFGEIRNQVDDNEILVNQAVDQLFNLFTHHYMKGEH